MNWMAWASIGCAVGGGFLLLPGRIRVELGRLAVAVLVCGVCCGWWRLWRVLAVCMTWTRPTPEQQAQRRAEERHRTLSALCKPIKGERSVSMGGGTTGAKPKERMLKSAAYENAVRNVGYCVRCGFVCRPQLCHRDEGKGMGLKTDSRECWAGCGPHDGTPGCHHFIGTAGALSKQERRAEDLRLGALTRATVKRLGLWPKSVPMWDEGDAQ